MPPPAGDNHGWVVFAVRTGFALGHRASTFHACAHLITTAVRYQLWAKVAISSPNPTWSLGSPGEVPASVHTMGLPGKVLPSGTFPAKRDPVRTGCLTLWASAWRLDNLAGFIMWRLLINYFHKWFLKTPSNSIIFWFSSIIPSHLDDQMIGQTIHWVRAWKIEGI